MTRMFETAVAKVATLSPADQDHIGRELLAHVEKLQALRDQIVPALDALDRGEGREVDIEEFLKRARERDAS